MKKKTLDMTEGSPLRLIIAFTIPIILGNIFQQLYNIGDAKVVSFYLDENAFGSVGMTAVVSNTLIGLINGFTQGFGILTANAFGARDEARIRRYISGAARLTALLTVALTALAFIFIRPVLTWLNTPAEMMDQALSYVRIILAGIPFTALYNLSANLLRSLGDSRTPLYCLIGSIVMNLLLDMLFVGTFHWGIEGAAIATLIAMGICSFVCFFYGVHRFKEYMPRKGDRPSREDYGNLFFTGLSMGLMGCIVNIGTIILQGAINGLGAETVAAHTAGRRLIDILMSLIYTYGFTMTTFVSQNEGAGKRDRIRKGVRIACIIVTVESVILILFSFLFAREIVTWIASTENEKIRELATLYCRVMICFFPALGPLFILRCTLQGVGKKIIPLVSSVLELTVKVFAAYFLVPQFAYMGVALAEPISWVLMTTILTIGYVKWWRKVSGKEKA
jgi:putative MATE family efflux protein